MEFEFQKLYELLNPVLPDGWKRIVLYTAFWGTSCETKFFVTNDINTIDCFELNDFNKVYDVLGEISSLFIDSRKMLSNSKMWNVVTVSISNNGDFECYYDYSNDVDHSDYFQIWEEKYILNWGKNNGSNV